MQGDCSVVAVVVFVCIDGVEQAAHKWEQNAVAGDNRGQQGVEHVEMG